jgi:hypothetical protein
MLTGCSRYRPRLIELARGATDREEHRVLMAHVELCADCARVLDEQFALSATLRNLSREALPEMAVIETRVLAEFDRAKVRRRRAPVWVYAAALAAATLIGAIGVERHIGSARHAAHVAVRAVQAVQAPVAAAAVATAHPAASIARARHVMGRVKQLVARVRQASDDNQPFMTIPYTVPLSPEERATVVRMEVPVAALIAAGFSVATSDPGGVVDADVLVSQDGRARAIRLASTEEEKR